MTRIEAINRIMLLPADGKIDLESFNNLKERLRIDHIFDERFVTNEELEKVLQLLTDKPSKID